MSNLSSNRRVLHAGRDVHITGALTGATLNRLGTQLLFRASREKPGPVERLTWEVVPPQSGGYNFIIENLRFATAEGAVGVAATIAALRRSGIGVTVTIRSDPSGWAKALGLARLADDDLPVTAEIDQTVVPVHAVHPATAEDRSRAVRILTEQAHALLRSHGDSYSDDKADALALVAREALLNVSEHAYIRDESTLTTAYVAITAGRLPLRSEISADLFTSEELEWFSRVGVGRKYLEIAIADCGTNVAYTLAEKFRGRFTKEFDKLKRPSSRAELHREIVLWSFHHESTRKSTEDFASAVARLNWRGLHTALRRAADHNGAIIMQSGRTRLGYTCEANQPSEFAHDVTEAREFPGTIVTLRLPIGSKRLTKARPLVAGADRLKLAKLVSFRELEAPRIATASLPAAGTLGIIMAFESLRERSDATRVRVLIETLPPQIVPVFLPVEGNNDAWLGLAALAEHEGPPRVAGFAAPGAAIEWKIVGVYPSHVAAFVKNLERDGFAIAADEEKGFASALRRAYPDQFTIRDSILRNEWHGWVVDDDDAGHAMHLAFQIWYVANAPLAAQGPAAWLFDSPAHRVLLRTGKYVRRFISIMRLLESNELLARAVAWKLLNTLEAISPGRKPFIVADSEASYFRLATLLRDADHPLDISIRRLHAEAGDRKIVLFADAVYSGETVRTLMNEVGRADHVIACLDLSPAGQPAFPLPFTGLLRTEFEAEELGTPADPDEVLECDAVTNVPEPQAATERFQIGTSDERHQFLMQHPDLLRHGLQRAGGRTHTLTLPCKRVLQYREQVLSWLVESLSKATAHFAADGRQHPLVIFYRSDAEISRIISSLAATVEANFDGVYGVPLPFVADGSREAFARASPRLLTGVRRLGMHNMLATRPSRPYIAFYIDDACVTGRTLFNFVVRAGRTLREERPAGVVVVPLVDRLSPAEEYFFTDLCSQIGGRDREVATRESAIPFVFAPLFRLQVGALVPADAIPINHFLTSLRARLDVLDDRSRDYAETVIGRADRVFHSETGTINEAAVVAHPLYTGTSPNIPISFRAVRLRQLLSLHEQNMGVLGELLHEFFVAFEERDASILSILALEPRLLNVAPVHNACWRGISDLSVATLRLSASDALKSDALAVLTSQGEALVRSLHEILPALGHSRALVDQLVVSLYELDARVAIPSAQSLIAECSGWASDDRRYLWRTLASIERLGAASRVQDENAAWDRIISLISRMMFHATTQERLTTFKSWLEQSDGKREATRATEVRALASAAIEVVDTTLRPALDVLEWLARRRGDVDVLRRIRDERPQLIHATSELQDVLLSLSQKTVGKKAAAIAVSWEKVQSYSLVRSAELILAERDSPHTSVSRDERPPLIEEVLPRYACWPTRILASIAKRKLNVSLDFGTPGSVRSIVVVPCPLKVVSDVIDLIVGDMLKHGTPGSYRVSASYHSDTHSLIVTFSNRKKENDVSGSKRSQAIVADFATEWDFVVRFDPPSQAGQRYAVVLEFPRTFPIEIDRLR